MGLTITIVTPAPAGSRAGNRVSALRHARLLRGLGHRVRVLNAWGGAPSDVLIVLNAQRGAREVLRAREERPEMLRVAVLTGTDVYGHLGKSRKLELALDAADAIVGLQADCVRILPSRWRRKARTILQSYDGPPLRWRPARGSFDVLVLGHLRSEKDPFRAALAARGLPPESKLRVLHAGKPLSPAMGRRAAREAAANPRYRFLGELPRPRALAALSRARALVLTSRMEGGPSVFSEALALGVPILSTSIPAARAILSPRHPGLFPLGDTRALTRLLGRLEFEPGFLQRLARRSRALAPQVEPARESAAWKRLLSELVERPRTKHRKPAASRAPSRRRGSSGPS